MTVGGTNCDKYKSYIHGLEKQLYHGVPPIGVKVLSPHVMFSKPEYSMQKKEAQRVWALITSGVSLQETAGTLGNRDSTWWAHTRSSVHQNPR